MPEKENTTGSVDYASMTGAENITSASRQFKSMLVYGKAEIETQKDGSMLPSKPKIILMNPAEKDDKGNMKSEMIDAPVEVVFLKRRMVFEEKVSDGTNTTVIRYSNEFNKMFSDEKIVVTTKGTNGQKDTKEILTVSEAFKKYPKMRGIVRMYSMYNDELVRFTIKGTGVYEADAPTKEKTIDEYLSTFTSNENFYMYKTSVGALFRGHKSTLYFRPTFTQGAKLNPVEQNRAYELLTDIFNYCKESDARPLDITVSEPAETTAPEIAITKEQEEDLGF